MTGAGSNYCTVTSTKAIALGTTSGAGVHRFYFTLDPLNGASVNLSVAKLAEAYEFYRIKSARVEIVPIGGSNAVGSITLAYVNNSELIKNYALGGDATRDAILTREQGVMTRPLNMSATQVYNNTRVTSRKWYACNYALDATVDDYDRTIQSCLIGNANYSPTTVVPASLLFTIVYEFNGLGNVGGMTLFRELGSPFVVPYQEDDVDFPLEVVLRKRDGSKVGYVRAPTKPLE